MPCWIRPNPRSDTYSNMLLYLRFQVEEFAKNKYGSLEALDEEFEKRETQKEDRKKKRFKKKTAELRYKTLLERVKGQRVYTKDLGGHVHSFGPTVPCPEKEGWYESSLFVTSRIETS